MVKNVFGLTVIIICVLYFIAIFFIPSAIIDLTKNSAIIWFNKVFPTLFPYFIIVNILIYSKVINYISYLFYPIARKIFKISNQGFFAFFIGILSGYPVGIKTVCNLYAQNLITKQEANKLLFYVNNSGPLFIIGTVGVNLFKSEKYGQIIFLSHVISSIIMAIIVSKIYKKDENPIIIKKQILNLDLGKIFYNSIVDSINTIFIVGGFITLFFNLNFILDYTKIYPFICHLSNSLIGINKDLIKGLLYGLLEITNGVIMINQAYDISIFGKLIFSTFIISWGGLSVHFQSISFLNQSNLQVKNYIIGKLCHAILSVIVFIMIKYIPIMYSFV